MTNTVIRAKAKESNVKLWEIADKLGIIDSKFSRILRKELSAEETEKILNIIEQLAAEKA